MKSLRALFLPKKNALFDIGQVAPSNAVKAMGIDLKSYLRQHQFGHFGAVGDYLEIAPTLAEEELAQGELATSDDAKLNAVAIATGKGRVISVYDTPKGMLWITTDLDRRTTYLLVPDKDYLASG